MKFVGQVRSKFHLGTWHYDSCNVMLGIPELTAWKLKKIADEACAILECTGAETGIIIGVKLPASMKECFVFKQDQYVQVNAKLFGFFVNVDGGLVPRITLISAVKGTPPKKMSIVKAQSSILKFL
jgi:hypothetical protein